MQFSGLSWKPYCWSCECTSCDALLSLNNGTVLLMLHEVLLKQEEMMKLHLYQICVFLYSFNMVIKKDKSEFSLLAPLIPMPLVIACSGRLYSCEVELLSFA